MNSTATIPLASTLTPTHQFPGNNTTTSTLNTEDKQWCQAMLILIFLCGCVITIFFMILSNLISNYFRYNSQTKVWEYKCKLVGQEIELLDKLALQDDEKKLASLETLNRKIQLDTWFGWWSR